MTNYRVATVVVALALAGMVTGITGISRAEAQSLRNSSGPAERPPASFAGKQFVDSKGCVFVRAGYGGSTTWVPRVDRGRKVVCGARPTQVVGAEKVDPPATTRTPAARAPAAAPARTTVRTTTTVKPTTLKPTILKPVTPAATLTTGQPARKVILNPAPVTAAPAKPAVKKVKRKVVRKPAGKPARAVPKARATVTARPACDYGPASSAYVNSGTRFPVRCGPQAVHPADQIRAPVNRGLNDNTTIAVPPRPATQVPALNVRGSSKNLAPVSRSAITGDIVIAPPRPVTIPRGYKRSWTDGRLNPKRGIGKLSGELASSLIWTRSVPRRLIDSATGEDVTVRYGFLRYPYVSYAQQKRALMKAGVPIHEIDVQTRAAPVVPVRGARITPSARSRTTKTPTRPAKSTKNAAMSGQAARLVSVGVYSDKATIARAVARLRQIGLTPKVAQTAKGTIVAAGPYAAQDAARVLDRARKAGFAEATLR